MKNIPTAEEFLLSQDCLRNVEDYFDDVQPIDLIEFAKLHVQAALENAYKNACMKDYEQDDEDICWLTNDMGDTYVLDKNTILNAYPLENIK